MNEKDKSGLWHGRAEKPGWLAIDLESRSEVDLAKCGVHKYVEGKMHKILLFCYMFEGDEDVTAVDMGMDEELPDEVRDALADHSIIKTAWNAQFERTLIGHYLGHTLTPDDWQCTMVWAAELSLPLKLATAAEVLKVDQQKDKAGEALIKKFSVPQKPTKRNGMRTWIEPADDPEAWEAFKEYCKQDVRTEVAIRQRLLSFPVFPREWDYYHMDQRINDRGVLIDTELVEKAIECDLLLSEEMTKRAYELTGLENPNSVSQLKTWLDERGIDVDSLGKKDVADLIKDLDKHSIDDDALEMMKLRLQMAKSSVKKYQAADRYVCEDGRARGLFQFSGANRTQRWAGRGIQLQNLPQNHISTLDEARELIKMGEFGMLGKVYDNVPDILSQCLRTMLIAKPGCEFIVADFSAIEARVLAWLSGEQWRLDAFWNGEDIYCASASAMFGVPVKKGGINGELRQKGKVAELACIAAGSLVLTDKGCVPIENVTTGMRVWDGEEWVCHEGVVYKGEREVISYEGLTATPDHLVYIEGQPEPVQLGLAAVSGAHLVQSGDGGKAIWLGEDNKPGEKVEQENESLLCSDTVPGVWSDSVDVAGKSEKEQIKGLSKLFTAEADSKVAGQEVDSGKAEVRKPDGSGLQELRGKRDKVRLSKCTGSGTLSDSGVRYSRQIDGDRQNRHEHGLRKGKPSFCGSQNQLCQSAKKCPEQVRAGVLALQLSRGDSETFTGADARSNYSGRGDSSVRETEELAAHRGKVGVYDIRNAGRHHRFTVSGKLVHNCGYGGAAGALINMGALDMGLKEEELPGLISDWRSANPKIVQFWWDIENAAMQTFKDREIRSVGRIGFEFSSGTLWIQLPSGRRLAYLNPKLQPNRFGRMALTFMGLNTGNKWSRGETYSGKIVENITQATARDLLAEAMWRMEKKGLDIVGHVHDEVILEVPEGSITVDGVCRIMNENPEWAEGLPLNSDGYSGKYYFKS